MKKFIVIYYSPAAAMKQMASMPKEMQAKGLQAWGAWAKKCGKNLVDLGSPLLTGKVMGADGNTTDSKKQVTGYSVLQAKSIDKITKLLQGHPHTAWNPSCSIEVYETMALPGM